MSLAIAAWHKLRLGFLQDGDVGVGVFPKGRPPSGGKRSKTSLLREIQAAQQVLEARVGTQTIKAGIDLNLGHAGGVLLISLF